MINDSSYTPSFHQDAAVQIQRFSLFQVGSVKRISTNALSRVPATMAPPVGIQKAHTYATVCTVMTEFAAQTT